MLEILKITEFWIALAVTAVLSIGMGVLKKYLRRLSAELDKDAKQKERKKNDRA